MCDPVSAGLAFFGAMTAHSAEQGRKSASQARTQQREQANAMESERANAEAEAAQNANARLAAAQKRRREQGGLLATGAQAAAPSASVLDTANPVTNGTANKAQGLLARGATFYQ